MNAILEFVIGHRSRFSFFWTPAVLFTWSVALCLACYYDGVLKTDCPSFFDLDCPGVLDNYVFPVVVVLLWALCYVAVGVLTSVRDALDRGVDTFFEIKTGNGAKNISALRGDIDKINDRVFLNSRIAKLQYGILMSIIAILVIAFQVVAPFKLDLRSSWALRPTDFPLAFGVAVFWALFYYLLIIGNAIWIAAASSIGVFGFINRLSKAEDVIVIPLSAVTRRCFRIFAKLAALSSLILTLVAAIVLALTSKIYRDNPAFPLIIAAGLALPTAVFIVPIVAVRRAIRRGRNQLLEKTAPLISDVFKALSSSSDLRTAVPKSERAILEFLFLERIHDRVETVSTLFVNTTGLMSVISLFVVQTAAWRALLGQLAAIWGRWAGH
jgi:hypothetical protein